MVSPPNLCNKFVKCALTLHKLSSTILINVVISKFFKEVVIAVKMGDRIRALREERGIRQIDLANHLGVALTTVSGWETNNRVPRIEVLEKIAEYFGVTPNYLLGEDSDISQLEADFPDGVRLLRRANNEMTEDQKKQLVKYMEFLLNNKNE